jgi:hypothetical protein
VQDDEGDSLEFQTLEDDSELAEFSRNSYRIQVKERDDFSVNVETVVRQIADLSRTGVSFLVDADSTFAPGDILAGCQLHLGDANLDNLDARVIHRSRDEDSDWICGVQWINVDEVQAAILEDVMVGLRQDLFE